MVGAKHFVINLQRAIKQWLSIGIFAFIIEQRSKIVQGSRQVWMFRSEHFLIDSQTAPIERFRFGVFVLIDLG